MTIRLTFTLTLLLAQFLSAQEQKSVSFSYGYSSQGTTDGAKSAAESAFAGLKGKTPKLVFVVFKENELSNVNGAFTEIGKVFDKSITFGTRTVSDANAILTVNGRVDKIIVVAIAGNINFASASATPTSVGDGNAQNACGKTIGEALRASISNIPENNGKFIVLYGDCHIPVNDNLTKGLISTLTDKKFSIVGNASVWVMEKGTIYSSGKNMGLLIWGDFIVHSGMAFDHEGSNDADAIVQKAYTAIKRAGADTAKVKPDFCLINNCRGRFGTLTAKTGYQQKEADTIRHTIGMTVPVVGIYGSGEMGNMTDNSESVGDGNSVSVLTITSKYATSNLLPANKHKNLIIQDPESDHNFSMFSIDGRCIGNSSAILDQKTAPSLIVKKNKTSLSKTEIQSIK